MSSKSRLHLSQHISGQTLMQSVWRDPSTTNADECVSGRDMLSVRHETDCKPRGEKCNQRVITPMAGEWSNRKSSASDVCHLTHTQKCRHLHIYIYMFYTHTHARTYAHTNIYIYIHTHLFIKLMLIVLCAIKFTFSISSELGTSICILGGGGEINTIKIV